MIALWFVAFSRFLVFVVFNCAWFATHVIHTSTRRFCDVVFQSPQKAAAIL